MVMIYFLLLTLIYGLTSAVNPTLPTDEVEALRVIGKTLEKTTWNFSFDPCDLTSNRGRWRNHTIKGSEDSVICNCSFINGTVCHVTNILLKTQDLQGSLPKEFVGLPFLQELNLARNDLSGSIPPEWGALPLVQIILLGNRLTGPIPKEFGSIITLERLVLENNQLSGKLPPELGSLTNLQRLYLSSNKFTGIIPSSFAKLTSLRYLRISDNQFRGTIPDFIDKWTQLEYMVLHSSGLVGPIPLSIANLTKLTQLRISDMTGPESPFPPLRSMQNLRILILRNLNLTGELPSYLGTNTSNLTFLDLSFNKLSGAIPSTYVELRDVKNVYLTGNMLNGSVPRWMVDERGGNIIDLTYNKFSKDSTTTRCYHNNMNLFASSYTRPNKSLDVYCLNKFKCPKTFYGLYINCGGDDVIVNGTLYEADNYDSKQGYYDSMFGGWVSSNTGIFLEDTRGDNIGATTWSDPSKLSGVTNPGLYAQARLSAISLTYYASCLRKGSYKVKLHFAEIMFNVTKSHRSLGRRLFDIYIQGVVALKDFNIADEAGGVGKAVVKTFPVMISDGKLEIRFYWSGKGTVDTGVYGPLISAISIIPDFTNLQNKTQNQISLGELVGIVVAGVVLLLLLIGGILWWRGCRIFKNQMQRDLKNMDFNIKAFSLRQIRAATNNFSAANKIGEGGFGVVYKGVLTDGTAIAVKQLSENSKQGNREFLNEIGVISALQHPHLVKLHGCCVEGDQLLVVYEFLENNSLSRALFGPQHTQISLDWPTRQKICLGVARGLAYLHEESRLKILHRDLKAANVLLDQNLSPKISDFGLAKLYDADETHISTAPAGTFGYLAPEYVMRGHLSDKSDIYSFGVLALEIVYGKSNTTSRSDSTESLYFPEWVRLMLKQGKLAEFVDSRLQTYDREEALLMVKVGILCTTRTAAERPLMSIVVKMLEGKLNAELDVQLASECEDANAAPPNLMKIMSEIEIEFEQSPETSLLTRKGKEKVTSDYDSFSFEVESSIGMSSEAEKMKGLH